MTESRGNASVYVGLAGVMIGKPAVLCESTLKRSKQKMKKIKPLLLLKTTPPRPMITTTKAPELIEDGPALEADLRYEDEKAIPDLIAIDELLRAKITKEGPEEASEHFDDDSETTYDSEEDEDDDSFTEMDETQENEESLEANESEEATCPEVVAEVEEIIIEETVPEKDAPVPETPSPRNIVAEREEEESEIFPSTIEKHRPFTFKLIFKPISGCLGRI